MDGVAWSSSTGGWLGFRVKGPIRGGEVWHCIGWGGMEFINRWVGGCLSGVVVESWWWRLFYNIL